MDTLWPRPRKVIPNFRKSATLGALVDRSGMGAEDLLGRRTSWDPSPAPRGMKPRTFIYLMAQTQGLCMLPSTPPLSCTPAIGHTCKTSMSVFLQSTGKESWVLSVSSLMRGRNTKPTALEQTLQEFRLIEIDVLLVSPFDRGRNRGPSRFNCSKQISQDTG